MISILNRITSRARKLIILMIIIPLITAAVAAYTESKKPTTYTANSFLTVGNFNNNDLKADLSSVESIYKSKNNINKIKKASHGTFNVADIKSRLVITGLKNTIAFQYSGTDEKEVKETLTNYTKGFEKVINQDYYDKKKEFYTIYNQTDKINTNPDSVEMMLRQELLFNIQSTLKGMNKAEIQEINDPVAAYSNPIKRGIFGLILGLMLDIIIIVLPEFFREYR